MDYRHFHQLIEQRGSATKEDLAVLQEFVREYPYCQTGQMLLAVGMYRQGHVRYEQQVKRTSAAIPDRIALFNLIHSEPVKASIDSPFRSDSPASPFVVEPEPLPVNANPVVESAQNNPFSDHFDSKMIEPPHEEASPPDDSFRLPLPEETETVGIQDPAAGSDPREIIRRRLAELLGPAAESVAAKKEEPAAAVEHVAEATSSTPASTETPVKDERVSVSGLPVEPEAVISNIIPPHSDGLSPDEIIERTEAAGENPLEGLELEYAMEESLLLDLEKLPVIQAETETETEAEAIEVTPERGRNFTEWLRATSKGAFGNFEVVHAETETETETETEAEKQLPASSELSSSSISTSTTNSTSTSTSKSNSTSLIDQFIANEPRIVPQLKREFYNPAVQAKRSIEEHDDLVSETLARIYASQGNHLKARSMYERLGLLYPEKSAYFAALIQGIDQQLNSSSEDL